MFENQIKGTHHYTPRYTNMSQSQNRDALYAMISQNREAMVMFIEYMMNKNKDSENCESLIEEFVREHSNMRSNSPEPSTLPRTISRDRISNSEYLCDNS